MTAAQPQRGRLPLESPLSRLLKFVNPQTVEVGFAVGFLFLIAVFCNYAFWLGTPPLHAEDWALWHEALAQHQPSTALHVARPSITYSPIVPLTVALNFALSSEPSPWIFTNILVHWLNAGLLFLCLRRLATAQNASEPRFLLWFSFGLAALFLVAPICFPVVGTLYSRAMLFGVFFALLGTERALAIRLRNQIAVSNVAVAWAAFALSMSASPVFGWLPLFWALFPASSAHSEGDADTSTASRYGARVRSVFLLMALSVWTAYFFANSAAWFHMISTLSIKALFVQGAVFLSTALAGLTGGYDIIRLLLPPVNAGESGVTGLLFLACLVVGVLWMLRLLTSRNRISVQELSAALGLAWIIFAAGFAGLTPDTAAWPAAWKAYVVLAGVLMCVYAFGCLLQPVPFPVRTGVALILLVPLVALSVWRYARTFEAWEQPEVLWFQATEQYPDSPKAWEYRAWALQSLASATQRDEERSALWETTAKAWARVAEVEPSYDDAHVRYAVALSRIGTPTYDPVAKDELVKVRRRHPHDPEVNAALAAVVARMYQRAQREQLAKGEMPSPDALEEVLRTFTYADEQGALDPDLAKQYAMALLSIGDLRGALRAFAKAGSLQGEETRQLNIVQARLNTVQNLEKEAEKIQAESPFKAFTLEAQAALLENQFRRALYLAETAVEKDIQNEEAWFVLGVACAASNLTDYFINRYKERFPDDPQRWDKLAFRTLQLGLVRGALNYLEYDASLRPDAPLPELRLAEFIGQLRLPEAGKSIAKLVEQAMQKYPQRPEPYLLQARAAAAQGNEVELERNLAEAAKRGADTEVLQRIREGLRQVPSGQQRTIIR